MGYYEPSFAGLDRGWYLQTDDPRYALERDECLRWWDSRCDALLRRYLERHGMFITAFARDIQRELRSLSDTPLKFPRYFEYFIKAKIFNDATLAAIFREDYARRGAEVVVCTVCQCSQPLDDIHPSLIGRAKRVLPLCNKCGFWIAGFVPLHSLTAVTDDLKDRVRRLSERQICPVCSRSFVWLKAGVRYSFEVPFLPTRHIEICPTCVQHCVTGTKESKFRPKELATFKRIADLLGCIPDRNGFVYDQAPTLEVAVQVVGLMRTIPSFKELAASSGSWFKLLIESAVLPEGTRQTPYGTMVVAEDGHECLSLAEKSIDDLLFRHGITHEKEPHYPDSSFRADWKIRIGDDSVLIEFFGLDGKPAYMRRMREKLALAEKHGLRIIAFTPRDLTHLQDAFRDKILSLLTHA